MYVVETRFKPPYGRKKKLDYLKASRMLIKTNIVGMDDCDGYVRGWGTYRGMDAPEGCDRYVRRWHVSRMGPTCLNERFII